MKILVCAKRVVDANVKVRPTIDESDLDIEFSKMSVNPFDENAIEEAVKLKANGFATEVVVVSIGNAKCEDTLRNALARGCDRAILVETNETYEPINIANILQAVVKQEQADLIILGKQAIDDDANQVAQMLAAKLDYPQAMFASKIDVEDKKIVVRCEIDGGVQIVKLQTPAIISADTLLNDPKFIKLPQLMMAKKKPLTKIQLSELNLDLVQRTKLIKVIDGEKKKTVKLLSSVDELVDVIKQELTK